MLNNVPRTNERIHIHAVFDKITQAKSTAGFQYLINQGHRVRELAPYSNRLIINAQIQANEQSCQTLEKELAEVARITGVEPALQVMPQRRAMRPTYFD